MRRLAVLLVLPLLALASCGDDDDDDAGGGGGGGDSTEAFCARAVVFEDQFDALEEQFEGTEFPAPEAFEQAADAIDELADGAPAEVEGDMRAVSSAVREIAEMFGEIDLSDPEALADPANADALIEMGERMETLGAEVEESADRAAEYLEEECGISIDE